MLPWPFWLQATKHSLLSAFWTSTTTLLGGSHFYTKKYPVLFVYFGFQEIVCTLSFYSASLLAVYWHFVNYLILTQPVTVFYIGMAGTTGIAEENVSSAAEFQGFPRDQGTIAAGSGPGDPTPE